MPFVVPGLVLALDPAREAAEHVQAAGRAVGFGQGGRGDEEAAA